KTNRGEVESHRMTPLQILDFFRVTIDAACGPGGKSTKLQVRDRGHGKTNPQLGVSQAKSMYKREELVWCPSEFFATPHLVEHDIRRGLPTEMLTLVSPIGQPRID